MKTLVTGGAGFIGRWVVERLLREGHQVRVLDDYSNGRRENLRDFEGHPGFLGAIDGDIKDAALLRRVFDDEGPWDLVFHLAASIHVQRSIDDPEPTFRNDAEGTFRVLEEVRRQYFLSNGLDPARKAFDFDCDVPLLKNRAPRMACMSTCMVYDLAGGQAIREVHPYRPASPYAASKIASDMLALSYFHSYRMPVTVVRPFNTYGPYQKSNSEGGVVSIFLKRDLAGDPLLIKGAGTQTRDLLYVEDCAEFVVRAAMVEGAEGHVINAGTGSDVTINALAAQCCSPNNRIEHVAHDHPQAEIARLLCDATKAREVLGWTPRTSLEQGLAKTRTWLNDNRWAW
ncbi:MAG: GDP-mannose 4,6-dehydratase [Deltaproteobacteria bacterium]|nr:GDP-mannose 4,6-dehydratase [Deltaproteobacteria bacterium]